MESARRTRSKRSPVRRAPGMHVCPDCSCALVQPTHWFEEGHGHWHVELRCPGCEWRGDGSFAQDEVDRFDVELDRGHKHLAEDLRSLARSNMEADCDRFATALEANRILPEDF